MRMTQWFAVALLVLATTAAGAAATKIRTEHDKSVDFRTVKTWAWHPDGAADVKILERVDDTPESIKARFDSIIQQQIAADLAQRGLAPAAAGATPDVYVNYYLLLAAGLSTQTMGQFLPATTAWGLPPFLASTTSFKAAETGSLVIDLSAPAKKAVIWRGIAAAEVDRQRSEENRTKRIREAITGMLKRFPPKK